MFGCSTVASVCALIALLRLLAIRLLMRLSMYETRVLSCLICSLAARPLNAAMLCRIRDAGKYRRKPMSERLLDEDVQQNRLALIKAMLTLAILVCKGLLDIPHPKRHASPSINSPPPVPIIWAECSLSKSHLTRNLHSPSDRERHTKIWAQHGHDHAHHLFLNAHDWLCVVSRPSFCRTACRSIHLDRAGC